MLPAITLVDLLRVALCGHDFDAYDEKTIARAIAWLDIDDPNLTDADIRQRCREKNFSLGATERVVLAHRLYREKCSEGRKMTYATITAKRYPGCVRSLWRKYL